MQNRTLDEEAIFHVARGISNLDIRVAYLDQICAGDMNLRQRVVALLEVHEKEQHFLKSTDEPPPTLDQPVTEGPGTVIGRYKLLQKIGEGGFGIVFMAEQQSPVVRRVALKVIKPGMDSHAVVARFEAERQALALMDHPNIAHILDGGLTDSGRPYFVMELVKGLPITDYCDKNELPTEDRLRLFVDVCRAVQHAHQKGVIHRDLKPSNIMVTLHDGKPVPRVIDFGVSKALHQRLTEKTLFTAFGQMIGTAQYMSPEQAEMSGLDVDTRSDVYSLGVLLYELLTGSTPLEGGNLRTAGYAEIQRMIRETEPPRPSVRLSTAGEKLTAIAKHRSIAPSDLQRLVRGDLDWIVMKSLEKERGRRYESANDFAADVERFLAREAVEAHPPSAAYRLRKFARRHRASMATLVIVATSLLLGLFGTTWQMFRAIDARKSEAEQRKIAESKTQEAVHANRELKYQSYALLMAAAYQAWENADPDRARELLDDARNRQRDETAPDLAWRFLAARCEEGLPEELDVKGDSYCLAYAPDGQHLAVALVGGEVVLCELETKKVDHLEKPRLVSAVECLEFTTNGKYLLAGGALQDSSGFVCVWELTTKNASLIPVAQNNAVFDVAVSSDATLGASVSAEIVGSTTKEILCTFKVWTLPLGEVRGEWTTRIESKAPFPCVAFLSGAEPILAGPGGGAIHFWDVEKGEELTSYRIDAAEQAFAISPDGKSLVTGGVRLWDLAAEVPQSRDKLTWRRCDAYAFSADNEMIAARDRDSSKVFIWFRESLDELARLSGGYEIPSDRGMASLQFSPDGNQVALGRGTVKIWDLKPWKRNRIDSLGQAAAILPSASKSAVVFADRLESERRTYRADFISGRRSESLGILVASSPDGRRFATQTNDSGIEVWDSGAEAMVREFDEVCCPPASLSLNGQFMATNGVDNKIRIWAVDSGDLVSQFEYAGTLKDRYDSVYGGLTLGPLSLSLDPSGKRVVSVTNVTPRGVAVEMYDRINESRRQLVSISDIDFVGATFSPNGKYIVVTQAYPEVRGGPVRVWDAETPESGPVFDCPGPERLMRLRFSENGHLLVLSGRAPGDLFVCDIVDKRMRRLSGTAGAWVNSLAFSKDNRTLVTSSPCGQITFWRMPTGDVLGTVHVNEQVGQLELTENEDALITMSLTGVARLWPMAPITHQAD